MERLNKEANKMRKKSETVVTLALPMFQISGNCARIHQTSANRLAQQGAEASKVSSQ